MVSECIKICSVSSYHLHELPQHCCIQDAACLPVKSETLQGKVKSTPCKILDKILPPVKSAGKSLTSLVQRRFHPCVFLVIMGTFQEIRETNETFVLENSLENSLLKT